MARPRKTQPIAVNDGYANIVANLGTARDKAAHGIFTPFAYTNEQLLNAYTTSWLAAKTIDIPADDATRKWRSWIAKADQIEAIEALEKKLKLKQRLKAALIAARLWRKAYIYLNTQDQSQSKPLVPGAKEIKSLVVLTDSQIQPVELVKDINSPYYGEAEFYRLQTNGGDQVVIHASRLVVLRGRVSPVGAQAMVVDNDALPVLSSCMNAILQLESVMANVNSLVFEAKVNVFKFKDFASMVSDPRNDALLSRRLSTQAAHKGINGDVVIDAEDDFQTRNASFGSLPEIITKYGEQYSAASGIPYTRVYGRAAAGLSGSGEGDERTYYDSIEVLQKDIGDAMGLLDECIITQALNGRPPEVYYEWKPLRQLTQSERADIFSKTASALRALAGSQGPVIPADALSDAAVNEFVEQGMLPGLQAAIEKYGSLNEQDELTGGDNDTQI